MFLEKLLLVLGDVLEKHVAIRKKNFVLICQIPGHCWQDIFVHYHDGIQCTLSDLQRWQVRQKVIAHEETKEHKIVNQPLEIETKRKLEIFKLQ